jgi:hypothetical protein
VPIVPAAVIFDLTRGQSIAPSLEDGRRAFEGLIPCPVRCRVRLGLVPVRSGERFPALRDKAELASPSSR